MSPYVTSDLLILCRRVLAHYSVTKSASHACSCWNRLRHYFKWASAGSEPVSAIHAQSLANYRASLEKRQVWYVGVISGLIRSWSKLGYPGLGDGVVSMINGWTLRGNIKGEAVQLKDPYNGALTDLEFEAFYVAVTAKFEDGGISIGEFALVMLFAFSGRRSVQLCDLKGKDLIIARASDGLTEYILNVPRAKVRSSGFREEFKPFALNGDNGAAIEALLDANTEKLAKLGARDLLTAKILPLFPNWQQVKRYVHMSVTQRSTLPDDYMHSRSTSILGTDQENRGPSFGCFRANGRSDKHTSDAVSANNRDARCASRVWRKDDCGASRSFRYSECTDLC